MNICVFGDSIAWGCNDTQNGGWVTLLRNYLETKEQDISVYNLGICGDTTAELLKRVKIEAEARQPDLIIFAIGINDAKSINNTSFPQTSPEQFHFHLKRLLTIARGFTDNILLVGLTQVHEQLTAPDPWGTGESYQNNNIQLLDEIIRRVCAKEKLTFIPMDNVLTNTNLADGLHPNSTGHQKIFTVVKPVVEKMLQSN